mmetsp:Transcript_94924/g.257638  ORF Transcript_94924/g.257638 Transcript_94924/m.257638 type:complete len:291 (+) Transcript_94924:141-1013(+)
MPIGARQSWCTRPRGSGRSPPRPCTHGSCARTCRAPGRCRGGPRSQRSAPPRSASGGRRRLVAFEASPGPQRSQPPERMPGHAVLRLRRAAAAARVQPRAARRTSTAAAPQPSRPAAVPAARSACALSHARGPLGAARGAGPMPRREPPPHGKRGRARLLRTHCRRRRRWSRPTWAPPRRPGGRVPLKRCCPPRAAHGRRAARARGLQPSRPGRSRGRRRGPCLLPAHAGRDRIGRRARPRRGRRGGPSPPSWTQGSAACRGESGCCGAKGKCLGFPSRSSARAGQAPSR